MTSSRRVLLKGAGVSIAGLSGCFGFADDWGKPPEGGLKVANQDDETHSLTVIIENRPEPPEYIGSQTPAPNSTPTSTTEYQYTLNPGGSKMEAHVVSPGQYLVWTRLDGEIPSDEISTKRRWMDFYPAGPDGDKVGGGYIAVRITNSEHILIDQPSE